MKEPDLSARDNPSTIAPPSAVPPPSTGGSSSSGPVAFITNAIKSGIALAKNPAGFMESNKDTPTTVKDLMMNYVAVLAAIPLVATLIGDLWYYDVVTRVSSNFVGFAFLDAVLLYIFDVAAVYILSIVIRSMATTFGSSTNPIKALKLSAYIYTPAFLIAIVFIIPILDVLGLLGLLYGLYILYLGLPIVLGTPKEKVIPYLFAIVIAVIIIYIIFAVILGAVLAASFAAHMGYL